MRNILCTIALALLAVTAANAQKAVKYNQYGVAVESDVLDVEAQDGILVMESPKSGYKLWFDIRAQADAAVFFGEGDLLQRNAAAAETIPYEMLTSVSPRVKRVYFQE
jgi:hypothetical protein